MDASGDKRKNYCRETKLAAIQFYHECEQQIQDGEDVWSTLRGWIQHEAKIQASSRGTRRAGSGRIAFWTDMEAELHRQYRELCEKGLKVKAWWFEAKSKELMKEMHSDVEFKFCSCCRCLSRQNY